MLNPLLDSQLDFSPELEVALAQLAKVDTRMQMSFEQVPQSLDFPAKIDHLNQLIFPQRLTLVVVAEPAPTKQEKAKKQLAFGQRVQASEAKSKQASQKPSKPGILKQGNEQADSGERQHV